MIGQSGSGKTVFLKKFTECFEPTSGHILFDGRDIVGMSRQEKEALSRNRNRISRKRIV